METGDRPPDTHPVTINEPAHATGETASNEVARRSGGAAGPEISVIIPTRDGGRNLDTVLEAISAQEIDVSFEIVCIDSGSSKPAIESMKQRGAVVTIIPGSEFNHGLTRDLGARLSRGRILVFLNQDAVPADTHWLAAYHRRFAEAEDSVAALQGGMREVSSMEERFFWDSCGERFYFTSESKRWIARYGGIGFSTVNCAIRRNAWEQHPFGHAMIMEDKKWQREITAHGLTIAYEPRAMVIHTHRYGMQTLIARCISEGSGWRQLGETYSLSTMLRDMCRPELYVELVRGRRTRPLRSAAELLFPLIRPLAVFWGNHFVRPA